jgi:hypothetical protein
MKLSQIAVAVSFLIIIITSFSYAETTIQSTALLQVTKKCADASSANIDQSIIRAEIKASAKPAENLGGTVHLRFQAPLGNPKDSIDPGQIIRQAYWDMALKLVTIRGGRWYSTYTTGAYFGKYLYGVKNTGSGSMGTNYNVVDGVMANMKLEKFKTDVSVALLPQNYSVENFYACVLGQTTPVKKLTLKLGVNIQAITPGDSLAAHRFILNGIYQIIPDLNVFAEAAVVDFNEARNNAWLVAGVDIPTAKILDQLRIETEYKSNRIGDNTDADFAWMIILVKKVKGLGFYVNIGTDPKELGSKSIGDIGGHLRIAANF